MANRRSDFGSVRAKPNKAHPKYWEASYTTPLEYAGKYPNQPKRQCRSFNDSTMAHGWLYSEKRLINSGVWTPPSERKANLKRSTITFGEYAPDWVKNRRKADGTETASSTRIKRRELLKNHLLPAFGKTKLADITPAMIDKWLSGYPKDSNSAYNAYTLLKPIMESAATEPIDEDGHTLIDRNPCIRRMARPKKKHKTVTATLSQVGALAGRMPERLALAVYLTGVLGLRIGEALALRRENVDVANHVIHVEASLKPDIGPDGRQVIVRGGTKTYSSTRDVPIPEALMPMIEEHLAKHTGKSPSAYLFTGKTDTEAMKENTFNTYIRLARAGVPGMENYWTHDGRHNSISRDAELGASNTLLMELAGHSDIRTSIKYQDAVSERHKKTIMQALSNELADVLQEPQEPQEQSASAEPSTADDITGLVDVLAAMPLAARVDVLQGLDAGRRSQVLAALPQGVQVETMTELFRKVDK